MEILGQRPRETRADATRMDELTAGIIAEHERAYRLARGRRGHIAADDELLAR